MPMKEQMEECYSSFSAYFTMSLKFHFKVNALSECVRCEKRAS